MHTPSTSDIIRRRTSWRTYNGEKLSEEDRQSLLSFIMSDLEPLFGSDLHFSLVDYDSGAQKLGTYGFIKNARHFIAGGVKPGDLNIEDYGYALEKIILHATSMGLGTCWLGGFFNKKDFHNALNPAEEEVMPAVTPVGYTQKNRGTFGKVVRYVAGSRNRKP
jgi:nitroreductase